MADARTDILDSIARALDGVASGLSDAGHDEVPRNYRHSSPVAAGSAEAVDILIDRLEDYRAVVHRVPADGVAAAVSEILKPSGSVVCPPGLPADWLGQVADRVSVVADGTPDFLTPYELDEIDAVITAARVACADTGTIVLDGEPDQGRRAITLVPDTHVCVVEVDQVVHLLPEAVTVLAQHPERPLTWISGPSATSDIELNRVEGVHGPRNLHVIVAG
jgi:L-lactate dehydrogenase complex protein LldG